jgi:hypothetical protein
MRTNIRWAGLRDFVRFGVNHYRYRSRCSALTIRRILRKDSRRLALWSSQTKKRA